MDAANLPSSPSASNVKGEYKENRYQILGIGTPIVDSLIKVQDDYINSLGGSRGGSILVTHRDLQKILNEVPPPLKVIAGGSAANTIKGLASLGHSSALIGKIGADTAGEIFSANLSNYGVTPCLSLSRIPTAQVASLITPDSDRTMRAFIGAGAEMSENDLSSSLFQGVNLVHIEGYLMNRPGVVEKTMKLAKEAGALVSFDTSSFEIVTEYRKPIIHLLTHFVDILFANEEEAWKLSGLPPERACLLLKDLCSIAVVKMGAKGAWGASGNVKAYQQAFEVPVIDTTGAGDLFASGFLHGLMYGKSLEESLRYGSFVASHVIQDFGAEISSEHWSAIKMRLAENSYGSL